MSELKDIKCICCMQKIDTENHEFDMGYNHNVKKSFYFCESCGDYSAKSIVHFENLKRLPKLD